jgi:hypothetical protein
MNPSNRLSHPPDYLLSVLRDGALPFSYRSSVRALLGAPVAMTGVASLPEAEGVHFEYAAGPRQHDAHPSLAVAEDNEAWPEQPAAEAANPLPAAAEVEPAPAILQQTPASVALPSTSPADFLPRERAGDAESSPTAPSGPPRPRPVSEPALMEPDAPPVEVSRRRPAAPQAEPASAETVSGSAHRETADPPTPAPDRSGPPEVAPVVLRIPSDSEVPPAPRGQAPPTLVSRSVAAVSVEPAPHTTTSVSAGRPRRAGDDGTRADPPSPPARAPAALTVRTEPAPVRPPAADSAPDPALNERAVRLPLVLHPLAELAPARPPVRTRALAGADATERESAAGLRPAPTTTAPLPRLREAIPEASVWETVAPEPPPAAAPPPLQQPAVLPARRWVPLRRPVPAAYWERRLGHLRARVLR